MSTKRNRKRKQDLLVPPEHIERHIHLLRDQKVMLDTDLAALYQVPTKVFNQAVKRNPGRFPQDFMFRLTAQEHDLLRSQNVTSNRSRGGRRYLPYAFTEHGVAMLSAVLKSQRAVQMSILVVRAFVKLREMFLMQKSLTARVDKVEKGQKQHHSVITVLVTEIQDLKRLPEPAKRRFGFDPNHKTA